MRQHHGMSRQFVPRPETSVLSKMLRGVSVDLLCLFKSIIPRNQTEVSRPHTNWWLKIIENLPQLLYDLFDWQRPGMQLVKKRDLFKIENFGNAKQITKLNGPL